MKMSIAIRMADGVVQSVTSPDPFLDNLEVIVISGDKGHRRMFTNLEHEIDAYLQARKEAGNETALVGLRTACGLFADEMKGLSLSAEPMTPDQMTDKVELLLSEFAANVATAMKAKVEEKPTGLAIRHAQQHHQ
jgi:hypothetical protein